MATVGVKWLSMNCCDYVR